jgi:perosamine synthetase
VPGGPPSWPPHDEAIREALEQAFADGSWGRYHGRCCQLLSERLAEYLQTRFVLLCCSGTFAVELALRAAGVSAGDEVVLAGYDFAGNFRSIEAIGARPVLVDVAANHWNLDVDLLPPAITPATKAIVASHLHGGIVSMQRVRQIADKHGIAVIEDACQCPGARVEGRAAGGWGDVGVLSFGGSKLLSAGRGGAIFTNQETIAQRGKIFCERGNHAFPLSELQAAVVLPQLARLDERNARRRQSVEQLRGRIGNLPGLRMLDNGAVDCEPGYYKVGFQYDAALLGGASRDDFTCALRAEGVALDAGFRGFALRGGQRCRVAGELAESRRAAAGMCVLHHPVLLEPVERVDCVARALLKVVDWATRGGALK